MTETAGELTGSPTITHFAWWFGTLVVVGVAALSVANQWPGAVGLLLGSIPVLWMTWRFRKMFRGPRTRESRPAGVWIMAGINATVGVVILFAGFLIGGDFIVIVTTVFGTWMITAAALLATLSKSV